MLDKKKSPATKLSTKATNKAVAVALDAEATSNLVGFFDVLIEMDLTIKEQERLKKNVKGRT